MNIAAFLWALEHLSPPRGHRFPHGMIATKHHGLRDFRQKLLARQLP